MRFVTEFRDSCAVQPIVQALRAAVSRPWTVMEICGGQTHAILRHGVDRLIPAEITLVHGPGCPVCVTPAAFIDRAVTLAYRPEVVLCTFGDMMRVPGSRGSLEEAAARGAEVRGVYSPLDALALARAHRDREVVFFAVGFETTAPVTAVAALTARREGLRNFSLLVAHVRIPPVLAALLAADDCRIRGLLAPGHVCAITGWHEYALLAARFTVPIVVTGFEPVDILDGLLHCVRRLETGRAGIENRYVRAVRAEGNPTAQERMNAVFEPEDRAWRGLGSIPLGGLRLREEFAELDALRRFPLGALKSAEAETWCGRVLRGTLRPPECPAFGQDCTPLAPAGAPMVSSEGACAAYHRYAVNGSKCVARRDGGAEAAEGIET